MMNYCVKCGNQLKPNAKFCGKCGAVISKLEPQPNSDQRNQFTCLKCGSIYEKGTKFCISCGYVVGTVPGTPNVGHFQAEPVYSNPVPVQNTKRRSGRKVLITLFSLLIIIGIGLAGLYFYGTYDPLEKKAESKTAEQFKVQQKIIGVKTDSAAMVVENAFAKSDTAALAKVLSPTSLNLTRKHFSKLLAYMPAFANDFKNRKLIYSNERYAVFGYETAKGKFTADFCLGDHGKWMLMRF